ERRGMQPADRHEVFHAFRITNEFPVIACAFQHLHGGTLAGFGGNREFGYWLSRTFDLAHAHEAGTGSFHPNTVPVAEKIEGIAVPASPAGTDKAIVARLFLVPGVSMSETYIELTVPGISFTSPLPCRGRSTD